MNLKGKRKRSLTNVCRKWNKQSVCSDAGERDKSVNNDQWPIGITVIMGGSILNAIVEVMWTRASSQS